MSPFEYLQTFLAIILGLGIADMLQSLHRLLVGPSLKWHWIPPLWAIAVFLTMLAGWLLNFDLEAGTGPDRYLRGSFHVSLLFLISSAALPDVEEPLEQGHPLREHFEVRWRYIAVLWSTFFASGLASMVVLTGWGSYEASSMAAGLMVALLAVLIRNVWYQTAVPILLIVNALLLMFR